MSDRADALAGVLRVRPGAALPTIVSTRRELAPSLGRGLDADELPRQLSRVFALCGGAHQVGATLAVRAARGDAGAVDDGLRAALRVDTLREHLRRLWLDWPRLLPALPPPDPAALASCTLLRAPQARHDLWAEACAWAALHLFGQPVADWLDAWIADPGGHAARWAQSSSTWPALALSGLRAQLRGRRQRVCALAAPASALELQRLSAQLHATEGFALAPTWRGHTAETGCWTRLADPAAGGEAACYAPLWMRHAARLADLARLLQPGGERALALGALATGPGLGLGWCEMARGLLLHAVQLGADGRVADARLVAPTEWNFHPFGSAARALTQLQAQADETTVRAVLAAYDPCVTVQVLRDTEFEHA
ncbi:MAG: hydrogenase maturation factor HoxV/HupK [Rubrivivax sp.]